jgi:hypothetical protein
MTTISPHPNRVASDSLLANACVLTSHPISVQVITRIDANTGRNPIAERHDVTTTKPPTKQIAVGDKHDYLAVITAHDYRNGYAS